ncbi:MAG: flagellar biosynthesis protein FlhF [Thermodesulfobacteriota bacterium]|nr:flagellar biosynthesis protein FlhF [Thermodesulfobacteriota bacterium]
MQVRVFESDNMDSALRQIKEALGPDALILSSRTVRKGGMGLFGKPVLEVTAAVEPDELEPTAGAENKAKKSTIRSAISKPKPSLDKLVSATSEDEISYQEIWEQTPVTPDPRPDPYAQNTSRREPQLQELHGEVGELRHLITTLIKDLPGQIEQATQPKAQPIFYPAASMQGAKPSTSNQQVLDALTQLGIEAEAAQTIAHYAVSQLSKQQINDPALLNAFFCKTIAELVQTTGSLLPRPGEQKRLALIGPTGVGKTTTIAKLAAAFLLSGGKRVAMITIDTYRIAAVEQLKVYGEIMNVPVEVVMTAEQLRGVLARHDNKDLILIDTAGRSPKDEVSLDELQQFLDVDSEIEPHLVLSATTRERDLYETYRRFSMLGPKSLLMTKLDECEGLGVLLNIHLRNNCPLSYLANGQKVPEDLVQANAELVSALVLESSEG